MLKLRRNGAVSPFPPRYLLRMKHMNDLLVQRPEPADVSLQVRHIISCEISPFPLHNVNIRKKKKKHYFGAKPDEGILILFHQESISTGRGASNCVIKCRSCRRENSADIIKSSIRPYTADGQWAEVVRFDCRGLEPVEFVPRAFFFFHLILHVKCLNRYSFEHLHSYGSHKFQGRFSS